MISLDDTPVEYLELSIRAANVLKRMKIATIGELLSKSPSDLRKCWNCGNKTVAEIQYQLAKYGVGLRDAGIGGRVDEAVRITEEIKRLKQTIAALRTELRKIEVEEARRNAARKDVEKSELTIRRIAELKADGRSYREISRELRISAEWCRKMYIRLAKDRLEDNVRPTVDRHRAGAVAGTS